MRTLSDKDWKTLSFLLCYAGEGEYAAVDLAELARDLGVDPAAAAVRLEALLGLSWQGEPLVSMVSQPGTADPLVLRLCLEAALGRPAETATDLSPAFQYAESVLARPLGNAEILAIRRWHEEYGFDARVIVALLEDCYRRDRKGLAYLEKVAASWYDQGVRDLADVERLTLLHRERLGLGQRVARYLGLSRKLTEAEQALIDKWTTEWGFALEVILKACSTTVNIDRPSFAYIDRVLDNWRTAGVRTPEDADRLLTEERAGKRSRRTRRPRAANFNVHYAGKDDAFYEQFEESAAKHRARGKTGQAAGPATGGEGPKRGKAL